MVLDDRPPADRNVIADFATSDGTIFSNRNLPPDFHRVRHRQ
jgi:hypothetical protein